VVRHRVPLHRSLLVRLLATSILVAVCAVAATAWLAVRTTSHAIERQQGQVLAADSQIYDELLRFAATHPGWVGVESLLADLARRTDRHIVLTDGTGRRLAASAGADPDRLPEHPSAIVDPLHVDTDLGPGTRTGDIDPRAVGPYRLTEQEKRAVHIRAAAAVACLTDSGIVSTLTETPSGRTTVTVNGGRQLEKGVCGLDRVADATPTETKALAQLTGQVEACLLRQNIRGYLFIDPGFVWDGKTAPENGIVRVPACLGEARRDQLRPFVASPARLYVNRPAGPDNATFDLAGRNAAYIAGVAGLVLLLASAVTIVVGRRLIRPLRMLTAAAQSPLDGHTPVAVAGDDEIGRLAAAFNDLAARRRAAEDQRRVMVSDIAHELRTPLANMRIWLEAAQDGLAVLDGELLETLNEEAILLQHVVDDLRDLAAVDSGGLHLDVTAVYAGDLLRQVVAGQRSAAEDAGVDLSLTIDDDDREVPLDPVRLRQIVGNLVSNALRHTPSGGRVTVRARISDRELSVQVADSGSGISPEDLPHVFDRFWRADKARSRNTGGSGLGLAIARQLARAHGGDLTAHSVLGAGSTFVLSLPAG
jgi:two-component system, OmpR family, sensor histidine kinase BaeS